MEVIRTPISNRDNKRTRPRFINVGGVEGLLVLGGSLAIAGLMALFTIKPRKSSPRVDTIHEISKQAYAPIVVDDGFMENIQLSSVKEGFEVVLDNHIDELHGNGGPNPDLRQESISSQISALVSEGVIEPAKQSKVEDEEEEEDECQHEILVLSDDSTPPESIVSCDEDYTESTDLSLDEENEELNKAQTYTAEEEIDQRNHINDDKIESSEEDDSEEEEEITERSSSLSSLLIDEIAAPKEFSDSDPNYESIAKEQNSVNSLGLEKKFEATGMFGSRAHLPPPVGSNEMVAVATPTKAQLWLMVLPVVMLTLLLAMIHFFVVDNYVLDMEF